MNDLQIFNYKEKPVRTIERDGGVWWVLKDVCNVLGIRNHSNVVPRLDEDERALYLVEDPNGQAQQTTIINEPGLYNVILRSDKPEAKDFKRWVTHDILPSIRQTGSYSSQPLSPAQLIAAQAQLLVDMERRMDEMQGQALALAAKVYTAIKAFSRPAEDHWKADIDKSVKELSAAVHWSLPKFKGKLYSELEQTANCNINARLAALRKRKRKTGMRYKDAEALTKLDAIAADKQLRAIFEGIVRSWQARAVPFAQQEIQ